MAEIPLIVINVQRGGPSTGMPTNVEQADLMQAIYGSHGDAPRVVLAPKDVEDCFRIALEAGGSRGSTARPCLSSPTRRWRPGSRLFRSPTSPS